MRTEALKRRAAIGASDRERAAAQIAARLEHELELPGGATVAGYWPLAGELDPRPAMARLRARGHALALPRLDGRDQPLLFLAWDEDDVLVEGTFKLLEPHPSRPLGYGKGYYDRTLMHLRSQGCRPLVFGLAFAAQEVEDVPIGPADVPLDGVVTETAVLRFEAGASGT
jgi:5-formyltetrahydrofolate cyclo-ligase